MRNTDQPQNKYVYDHQATVDIVLGQSQASTIPRSNEKHCSPESEQIQGKDRLGVLMLVQMFACHEYKEEMGGSHV